MLTPFLEGPINSYDMAMFHIQGLSLLSPNRKACNEGSGVGSGEESCSGSSSRRDLFSQRPQENDGQTVLDTMDVYQGRHVRKS